MTQSEPTDLMPDEIPRLANPDKRRDFDQINRCLDYLRNLRNQQKVDPSSLNITDMSCAALSRPAESVVKQGLTDGLTDDEIKQLKTTLGAMQLQEKRGMWQSWWGKFCKNAQIIISETSEDSK